jgi:hypothetical protein
VCASIVRRQRTWSIFEERELVAKPISIDDAFSVESAAAEWGQSDKCKLKFRLKSSLLRV